MHLQYYCAALRRGGDIPAPGGGSATAVLDRTSHSINGATMSTRLSKPRPGFLPLLAALVLALSGGNVAARSAAPKHARVPAFTMGCSDYVSCGFPSAVNTGVLKGTVLKPMSGGSDGINITQDGTVIDGTDITGWINVTANNVTIRNSRISTTGYWGIMLAEGFSGLKVLNCTIVGVVGQGADNGGEDYGIANYGGPDVEIAYNDISEFAHNFAGSNGYVHDNYMHDMQAFIYGTGTDYAHLEDVYDGGNDTRPLILRHNTFLDQVTGDRGETAAVYATDDFGPLANVTIDNNWMAGGAYALYAGGRTGHSTNIRVTHNYFSTAYFPNSGFYGPLGAYDPDGEGNVFSTNVFADGPNAGQLITP